MAVALRSEYQESLLNYVCMYVRWFFACGVVVGRESDKNSKGREGKGDGMPALT